IVPRRVPASMKIQAGRDGSFDKRLPPTGLAEDAHREGAVAARAAPRVLPHKTVWRTNQRRLAHVRSKEMQSLIAIAPEEYCAVCGVSFRLEADAIFCEAIPTICPRSVPRANTHAADGSRTSPRCRYFRGGI